MSFRVGMTEEQFWSSTIKAILMRLSAYNKENYEDWQRTRFESYVLYCTVTPENKRVPIYKFLELEGDPSEEELQKLAEEEAKKQEEWAVNLYEQMKDYL